MIPTTVEYFVRLAFAAALVVGLVAAASAVRGAAPATRRGLLAGVAVALAAATILGSPPAADAHGHRHHRHHPSILVPPTCPPHLTGPVGTPITSVGVARCTA